MAEFPRPLILPNTYYHVYNRGNNRRNIFREDADFLRFLMLLTKYMAPVGIVLSYALLPNHFHLTVLMNPAEDIPAKLLRNPHTLGNTFGHLQNAYAKYFNAKYGTFSSLFEKHFERKAVENLAYLRQLIVYHHRNPESHGITNDYREYFWTSYQEFAHPIVTPHVDIQYTLQKFGDLQGFFTAHGQKNPPTSQTLEFEDQT